jgi:hypothetical protein
LADGSCHCDNPIRVHEQLGLSLERKKAPPNPSDWPFRETPTVDHSTVRLLLQDWFTRYVNSEGTSYRLSISSPSDGPWWTERGLTGQYHMVLRGEETRFPDRPGAYKFDSMIFYQRRATLTLEHRHYLADLAEMNAPRPRDLELNRVWSASPYVVVEARIQWQEAICASHD